MTTTISRQAPHSLRLSLGFSACSRSSASGYFPVGVLRVVVPWITFQGLIDTAFDQVRHYAIADVAVSLRLIRALHDIATAAKREDERSLLVEVARRVMAGNEKHLAESEFVRVNQRVADLEAYVATGNAV